MRTFAAIACWCSLACWGEYISTLPTPDSLLFSLLAITISIHLVCVTLVASINVFLGFSR